MKEDMETGENIIREIVQNYYKYVDAKDLDKMIGLFSPEIVYIRGSRTINGIEEFERFYKEVREIADGRHEYTFTVSPPEAFVEGVFEGSLIDGENVSISFKDRFEITDGKVSKRVSTFPGREV